jgi:very-short-patch-repair endonuclease
LVISQPDVQTVFERLVIKEANWGFWFPPEEVKDTDEGFAPSNSSITSEKEKEPQFPFLEEKITVDESQIKVDNRVLEEPSTSSKPPKSNELVIEGLGREELERIIKNLYRRSSSDYKERGVRILYLSLGMLEWKEIGTSEVIRSPIILVPVDLSRESARDPFCLFPTDEDVLINPALQVKLRRDFKIELPSLPDDWEGFSLRDYFDSVVKAGGRLNWSVKPTALIGLFSFYKIVMHQDLEANESFMVKHPLISALAGESPEEGFLISSSINERELDSIREPDRMFHILDADSSQQVCIVLARQGQSFVMHGPPGTGKSQTISNIIAEFIEGGKTVLFVSEKMAALEVVFKRLREARLGDFCLELHSHKANKREVIKELNRSLEELVVPKKLISKIEFQRLLQLREKLNNYVIALHRIREPLGESVFNVLGKLVGIKSVPFVPVGIRNIDGLTLGRILELEELVLQLKNVWRVAIEGKNFPWYGCKESRFTLEVRSELSSLLERLISSVDQLKFISLQYATAIGLNTPSRFSEVDWLVKIANLLTQCPGVDQNWLIDADLDSLLNIAKHYQSLCASYRETENTLKEKYNEEFFKLPVDITSQIEGRWTHIASLLAPGDSSGAKLLTFRLEVIKFIKDTQDRIKDWVRDVQVIGQRLGLKLDHLTLERARQIGQLALLCCSEARPEADWVNPVQFQRIKSILPKTRESYEEYKSKKHKITELYDEKFLKLDLDKLIDRYNGVYRSFFRYFLPRFYIDKKMISKASHTGAIPNLVQEHLLLAREVNRMRMKLDEEKENVSTLLGRYYQDEYTNFDFVEQALSVASNALALIGEPQVPTELLAAISLETIPVPELQTLGSRLIHSLESWEQSAYELATLIPLDSLPVSGLPMWQSSLSNIEKWEHEVEASLSVLCSLIDQILKTCSSFTPPDLATIIRDLQELDNLRAIESSITKESDQIRQFYGSWFTGINTQWNAIMSALYWTKEVQELFGARPIPTLFVEVVSQGARAGPNQQELGQTYQMAVELFQSLQDKFETQELYYQETPLPELTLDSLLERIRELHSRIDELQDWIEFRVLENRFAELGLNNFFQKIVANPPLDIQLVDVLRRGIYQSWIDRIYSQDPHLGEFRGSNHEQAIVEFRQLDQKLDRLSAHLVIEQANLRKPRDIFIQARDTEIAVLKREAGRRRGHLPIRRLFEKIPNLLIRLKPCFLMSPLSVSQFLPSSVLKFDLVVFDEASQICTEDAVGAIYRGNQLVVAGDNRQLPPTAFFQQGIAEEYDWDDIDDEEFAIFESILDECKGIGLPEKMLKWHYRSKHESLITFSNKRFYNDKLVTFPSSKFEHETLGIRFVYVPDGIYDRGGKRNNLREAAVVADLVFEQLRLYTNKTLGVVAFNLPQMTTIEDEIELRRRAQPECERFFKEDRLEGFFVKNLENVQGDERDVIIFSVGYGYDKQGRFPMNFGPLNKPGGERRLNVAVTRAREKVILVSSIKTSNFDLNATQTAGVLNLYHYLDYAERGAVALGLSHFQSSGEHESPLEEDVALEIRRLGYEVISQVGCSGYRIDLGVVDPAQPGRFLLGVECDGSNYHSAHTARDRDRIRQQVLEAFGWRIHRIWSPDWVNKRDKEIKRLKQAIEDARQYVSLHSNGINPGLENGPVGSFDFQIQTRRIKLNPNEETGIIAKTIPYKIIKLRPSSKVGSEFHLPEYRREQSRLLAKLVEEEGPIHIRYAARRLVNAWGLERIGPRIVDAIKEAVRLCQKEGTLRRQGKFLWPPQAMDVPVRVPTPNVTESFRDIEHIPPEEIKAAMILIIRHAIGISVESLLIETARIFGFNRTGDNIRKELIKVFKELQEKGIIVQNGSFVTLK